jgi:hypothetical protein
MKAQSRTITIAISVVLQDAGEATRSLEIAKGLRDMAPEGVTPDIVFLTHGSKFEPLILEHGFRLHTVAPALGGVGPHADLKIGKNNFIGSVELAHEFLIGEQQAYIELHPDIVLHGFWPFASIARRMLDNVIPGICFLPIPMEPSLYCNDLMKDVPDIMRPLTYLPRSLRHFIISHVPTSLKLKVPIMRQDNILQALSNLNWKREPIHNLFDMLKADLTVVNDMELFYKEMDVPSNFKITGPLYAPGGSEMKIDPAITRVFARKGQDLNIFCSMGSSGKKELLLEAIRAISQSKENWHAVILAPWRTL